MVHRYQWKESYYCFDNFKGQFTNVMLKFHNSNDNDVVLIRLTDCSPWMLLHVNKNKSKRIPMYVCQIPYGMHRVLLHSWIVQKPKNYV